jgi:TRAP-type mannitol/chloroaromatic compound transport system substrate-binding protein
MRMLKLNKFAIILMALVLVLGITLAACKAEPTTTPAPTPKPSPSPTPEQETYTIRLQSFAEPGTYFHDKIMNETFIIPMEQMSNGRLKIEHSGSGSIVPNGEIHTAVGKGVVDMGYTTNLYYSGTLPVTKLEYGFPGQYEFPLRDQLQFLRLGYLDILKEAMEETFGVHYLMAVPDYRLDLVFTDPVPRLSDIDGKKIRVGGSLGQVLEKAGASVVFLPGSELYTSLSTGVIEGVGYGAMNDVMSLGLEEITSYAVLGVYKGKMVGDIMINPDLYNSLPEDLQVIIQYMCEHNAALGGRYNDWQNDVKTAEWRALGNTAIYWPKEDMEQLTKWSLEIMDELAAEDPRWTAPAVEIMKEIIAAR